MAASVANTYARALAGVVFELHLDPAKTLLETQSFAELVKEAARKLQSLGNAVDFGGTEEGRVGRYRRA